MTDLWLARTATGLTVLLPLGLLYARAIADTMLSVVGVLFLISLWRRRDWTWLRTPWTRLALVFWGWMLICGSGWRWRRRSMPVIFQPSA